MIEINLMPAELRHNQASGFWPDKKVIKLFAIIVFLAFAVFSLFLQLLIGLNSLRLKKLNSAMAVMSAAKEQIDQTREIINKYRQLSDMLLDLSRKRLLLAHKLNAISDFLPHGVWLGELRASKGAFEVKGSCVSAGSGELTQVGRLLSLLKADQEVAGDFGELELFSAQKRAVGPTQVVDFVIASKTVKGSGKH